MTLMALGDTAEFINGAAFKPTDWASEGTPLEVEIRGKRVPGKVEKMPFYKKGSRLS